MGFATNSRGIATALGVDNELPLVRRFRRTALSLHSPYRRDWHWHPQSDDEDALAGLVVIKGTARTASNDHQESISDCCILLHPLVEQKISLASESAAIVVWVPWRAISEVEKEDWDPTRPIAATALSTALRAFAWCLLTTQISSTPYTAYMVERLLTEMVFGVVLEAQGAVKDEPAHQLPLTHARHLMLLRRAESSFGINELAQEMHMSTRQLQRAFAKAGTSPSDELRRMRIDSAMSLLTNPIYNPLTWEEIAEHAGFTSAAALRRALASAGLEIPDRSGKLDTT